MTLMREKTMRLDDRQIVVVDDMVAEILKKKAPAEQLKLAFDTWRSASLLLFYHVKFYMQIGIKI